MCRRCQATLRWPTPEDSIVRRTHPLQYVLGRSIPRPAVPSSTAGGRGRWSRPRQQVIPVPNNLERDTCDPPARSSDGQIGDSVAEIGPVRTFAAKPSSKGSTDQPNEERRQR